MKGLRSEHWRQYIGARGRPERAEPAAVAAGSEIADGELRVPPRPQVPREKQRSQHTRLPNTYGRRFCRLLAYRATPIARCSTCASAPFSAIPYPSVREIAIAAFLAAAAIT